MRTLNIALAALLGLTALSALAQTPPPLDGPQEARAGHEPGVGQSLPLSEKAGNIAPGGAMPAVAPTRIPTKEATIIAASPTASEIRPP